MSRTTRTTPRTTDRRADRDEARRLASLPAPRAHTTTFFAAVGREASQPDRLAARAVATGFAPEVIAPNGYAAAIVEFHAAPAAAGGAR